MYGVCPHVFSSITSCCLMTETLRASNFQTTRQIKKVKDEKAAIRQQVKARNQSKRMESAENLLDDLIGDGAELLAMERQVILWKYWGFTARS